MMKISIMYDFEPQFCNPNLPFLIRVPLGLTKNFYHANRFKMSESFTIAGLRFV